MTKRLVNCVYEHFDREYFLCFLFNRKLSFAKLKQNSFTVHFMTSQKNERSSNLTAITQQSFGVHVNIEALN